jgi:hypothetical protein
MRYTKILPEANIELTGIWQMEFDTEDPATRYQNGILSDLEVLAIKRLRTPRSMFEYFKNEQMPQNGSECQLNG